MSVNRCYSEKKPGFDVEARSLFSSLHDLLEIKNLTHVRYLCRYDAEGLSGETYEKAKGIVFSEPMADVCYDEDFPRPAGAHTVLAVEPLPGQFDQRADSCAQCIQLLTGGERPTVAAAKIYVLEGDADCRGAWRRSAATSSTRSRPVRLRMDKPSTLKVELRHPDERGNASSASRTLDEAALCRAHAAPAWVWPWISDDLKFLPDLLPRHRKARPDHHRGAAWSTPTGPTTAATPPSLTQIDDVDSSRITMVQDGLSSAIMAARVEVYGEEKAAKRPVTLMDMGTIGAKVLKKRGISQESRRVRGDQRLLRQGQGARGRPATRTGCCMFKNETHNHPTEIEPFGGAATCLGGAIRDPLSGRSYVYQAMRVTGAGDPTAPALRNARAASCRSASSCTDRCRGLLLLRQPDRPCHRPGARDLPSGLRCKAHGDRRCRRRGSRSKTSSARSPSRATSSSCSAASTGRDGCGGATGSSKKPHRGSRSRPAALRCRRATRPRSARSSACSATARSPV